MRKRKHAILLLILAILAVTTTFFLFDRMIFRRSQILDSRFTDKRFIELMESLVAEGVFRISDGSVAIDDVHMETKRFSKKTEERIRKNIKFLYVKRGEIFFDRQSASISNMRSQGEEIVLRGRILDRNGVVLAESTLDQKSWTVKRIYTAACEMYPIIGHFSPVYGKRGIEKALDAYLIGSTPTPLYGRTEDPFKKIRLGDSVTLTVDNKIQSAAYGLLKGKKGAIVVLDVHTGEILAAVSAPSFDPNIKERSQWSKAFSDTKEKSYENRAFSALYPPGSTFKTVVASAWIDHGKDRGSSARGTVVMCDGRKNKYAITDLHAHGETDLEKALVKSCNLFFSEIGVILGQSLLTSANRFGFNKSINLTPQLKSINYAAEASLVFSWHESEKGNDLLKTYSAIDFKRNPGIVAQSSIGQNLVTATPLQMAMVAAVIANKGVALNPYVVREIKTADDAGVLFSASPLKLVNAIGEGTALKVKDLMEEVMVNGTGRNVKRIYLEEGRYTTSPKGKNSRWARVGGKTGTAEVGDKNGNGVIDDDEKPHSWFIGFAPATNPKIAVAVIAENQGLGALTAAPIAMEVMVEALNVIHKMQ